MILPGKTAGQFRPTGSAKTGLPIISGNCPGLCGASLDMRGFSAQMWAHVHDAQQSRPTARGEPGAINPRDSPLFSNLSSSDN